MAQVALGGWGREGGIVVAAAVNPQFAATVLLRFPPLLLIFAGGFRVGSEESITAPVQVEEVIAGLGQLFQNVNAPVHKLNHRPIRPPVTVTLGRFIAGEGERGAFVYDDDIFDSVAHGQVIGRADSGNACSTNDHIGLHSELLTTTIVPVIPKKSGIV
ncbi:MAG: hypothetical protein V9G20_05365 [Candidatus Promineifilaceae bacterium]